MRFVQHRTVIFSLGVKLMTRAPPELWHCRHTRVRTPFRWWHHEVAVCLRTTGVLMGAEAL